MGELRTPELAESGPSLDHRAAGPHLLTIARCELKAVDDAKNLVEVPAGRLRVGEHHLDRVAGAITNTDRTVEVSPSPG